VSPSDTGAAGDETRPCRRSDRSWGHHDLERLAVVHRAVAGAGDASFRAVDRDAEVHDLLDCFHLAVVTHNNDAVPEADVAVVEDEVAAWRPVADVSDRRVVSVGRTGLSG
jgi:hypothetical protein